MLYNFSKCRDQLSLKYLGEQIIEKVESEQSSLKRQVGIWIREKDKGEKYR